MPIIFAAGWLEDAIDTCELILATGAAVGFVFVVSLFRLRGLVDMRTEVAAIAAAFTVP